MGKEKEIIGGALVIGGRTLSLSKAIRAGDFVFLTGQIPMSNGEPMTVGTIEDQTKVIWRYKSNFKRSQMRHGRCCEVYDLA